MLKAVADRIIVKPEKIESDKFFIANDDNYTNVGIVESIGDRVTGVKIGDKIVFHRFDELPLGKNLVVIRQKSLLGIYK